METAEAEVDPSEALREHLQAILDDLDLGDSAPVLHVVLLPPLIKLRCLTLPPLRRAEIRRILARDAVRYFPGVEEPYVVGIADPRGWRRTGSTPFLAAAAPARVIDAIYETAGAAGWRIASVVPAQAAWCEALRIWPGMTRAGGWLVVLSEDAAEVLLMSDGRLESTRRLPRTLVSDRLPDIVAPGGGGCSDPVAIAGPENLRCGIEAALEGRGITVAYRESETWSNRPEILAAVFAGRAAGSEILPETLRADRERSSGLRVASLAAAGLALLVLGAALELWGFHRERDAIVVRRAAIQADAVDAMVAGEALLAIVQQVVALSELERAAPRRSLVISEVTEHLPPDAYIEALRIQEDTLFIEGSARRAAGAFEALDRAGAFTDVRAEGPIRRVEEGSGPPIDRFTLSARIADPPPSGDGS